MWLLGEGPCHEQRFQESQATLTDNEEPLIPDQASKAQRQPNLKQLALSHGEQLHVQRKLCAHVRIERTRQGFHLLAWRARQYR